MEKRIGVVIATYNGEKYIEEQLNSIIYQTVRPDLIVISDGGSSDETVNICKKILSDCLIEYKIMTSDTRLSVQDNFNRAFEACNSDYVFLSDQDDVWNNSKIEKTIKEMEMNNACMSFSNACIVDEFLSPIGSTLWESIGFSIKNSRAVFYRKDGVLFDLLMKKNIVTGMTICVTNDMLKKMIPMSSYVLHDKWIALFGSLCADIVAIDEPLVLYRQHLKNVVGTKASLTKTIQHRTNYYNNIRNRKYMIFELITRLRTENIDNRYITELECCNAFLEDRLQTIKRKTFIFWLIKRIKLYQKYEDKYLQIIIKDIYIWLFRNKLV